MSDHIVSFWTTFRRDNEGDSRTCAIFIPVYGLKLGVFGFSRNQNNCGSSGAYVTCIYCMRRSKRNTPKMLHGAQRSWARIFCVCYCMCGRQKPEDPSLSPIADDAITRGGLGSPLYICILNPKILHLTWFPFWFSTRYWNSFCGLIFEWL